MLSRFFALLIWAAVALSAAYWGLRWFGKGPGVPPGTTPAMVESALRGDVSRLLSGPVKTVADTTTPAPNALAGRVQLLGVVAPRQEDSRAGVALLTIDGKPARAYKVGQTVDGDLVIQKILQKQVQIGRADSPASLTLDLAGLPLASTGSLPAPTGLGGAPGYVQQPATAPVPPPELTPPGMAGSLEGSAPPPEAQEAPSRPRMMPPRLRRALPAGDVPPPSS
ncbi:type II secretion system protein N [Aquabacterium lacunae]|nr:type II secretion system protein N [Aquabacterium lacunae]